MSNQGNGQDSGKDRRPWDPPSNPQKATPLLTQAWRKARDCQIRKTVVVAVAVISGVTGYRLGYEKGRNDGAKQAIAVARICLPVTLTNAVGYQYQLPRPDCTPDNIVKVTALALQDPPKP